MQNYYEKEVLITSTYADRRCEVGIFQAGILIQDAMTEFFHQYDCDAIQMSRTHQAVWIRIFCGWIESELRSSRSKSPTSPSI